MKRSKAVTNGLLLAAPWITVATLLALSIALPNRAAVGTGVEARKAQIAKAMAEVPLFIGRWVGIDDTNIPQAAQQLLKPTGLLNRRYTSPGVAWVHVLVVHCNDARDMIGHYPPICYPSTGWLQTPVAANPDHTLTVQGLPFPVREYAFKGYLDGGREDSIRIFNAFILPDGTVTRSIDDMNDQAERLSVAVQGVAQVQVITPARVPFAEARSAAEEILSGMTVLFDALDVGRGASK
jgi:hypothetical protein